MNNKYKQLEKLYKNNMRCAEFFGLDYSDSTQGWFQRLGKPGKFYYEDDQGEKIDTKEILEFIENLVIPPAWKNTYISSNPKSHILALGEDVKERKQYIYHDKWSEARRLVNSYTLILFGEILGDIRSGYKKLLKSDTSSHEYVLGVALFLLDETVIRVGNRHYFDTNGTVGISTLRCENLILKSRRMYLEFPGKSGKNHCIHITNPKLKSCLLDLCSGDVDFIFSYSLDGTISEITPDTINNFLRDMGCEVVSAKDFRSWHASMIVFETFIDKIHPKVEDKQRKKIIIESFDEASEKLGNTRTMIKESYAHQDTVESVKDKNFRKFYNATKGAKKLRNLSKKESEFLAFLKRLYEENISFD